MNGKKIHSFSKNSRIFYHSFPKKTAEDNLFFSAVHTGTIVCFENDNVKSCYMLLELYYYTSREDTRILLDESHVIKLLATRVSVGSLTAVTIHRNGTHCQGAMNCKPTVS